MTFSEKCIRTRTGLTLYTESVGDPGAPSMLLIMGAMNQGLFWYDAFCKQLSDNGYFVLRYDHRDTGYSSTVNFKESPYNLDDLTNDAVDILDSYAIKESHVVGLSMGGYIGQLLAVNHPEKISTLTLISTTADHRPYMDATAGNVGGKHDLPYPGKTFLGYIEEGRRRPPQNEADAKDFVLAGWKIMFGGIDEKDFREIVRLVDLSNSRSKDRFSAFNHGLAVANSRERTELLRNKRIAARVFIFHGENDPCFPLEHGRFLNKLLPGSTLETIKGMGHMFSLTESCSIAERIVNNIKGL